MLVPINAVAGRGVTEPGHQLPQGRPGLRGQRRPGMPQVVESKSGRPACSRAGRHEA